MVQGLIKENVNVKQRYGTTELGPLLRTYPGNIRNSEIEKMRSWWPERSGLVMERLGQGFEDEDEARRDEQKQGQGQSANDGDGLYELVVYPSYPAAAVLWGPSSHTGLSASEPFRTNDLFREVPPKGSGYYVLEGRRDDIIISPFANNINAGAIEQKIVAADPGIRNALLMRPRHSVKLGLLVEVDYSAYDGDRGRERENGEEVNGDAGVHEDKDEDVQRCVNGDAGVHHDKDKDVQRCVNGDADVHQDKVKDVQRWVQRTMERVNRDLCGFEQVEMGMIKVLDRGTKLPVTVKGNVKRKEAERVLKEEIEELFGAGRGNG